jgi:mannitol/fructose-specific phosphotransferase system IIA component (Ntr-type)
MLLDMLDKNLFYKAKFAGENVQEQVSELCRNHAIKEQKVVSTVFFNRATIFLAPSHFAKESKLAVMISETPVYWCEHEKTNIAVFIFLHKDYRAAFYSYFALFLDLFNDNILFSQFMMMDSFSDLWALVEKV